MTRGRPPATAPRGRVTLAEASEISGLTRQEIHRRIMDGQIPSAEQGESGVWTIGRKEAETLERRPQSKGPRKAVMLRPYVPRYKAWEREAKRRGVPVSTLAGELLDKLCGWAEADE